AHQDDMQYVRQVLHQPVDCYSDRIRFVRAVKIIHHQNGLLFYLLADFSDKDVGELVSLRRQVFGRSYKAQHSLAELRKKALQGKYQIAEEDAEVLVGWINLIPDKWDVARRNEVGDESRFTAARVCTDYRRRPVEVGPHSGQQPGARQHLPANARRQ